MKRDNRVVIETSVGDNEVCPDVYEQNNISGFSLLDLSYQKHS